MDRDSRWRLAGKGLASWKVPGPDKIYGFWLKAFPKTNDLLKQKMWRVMDGDDEIPKWLIRGRNVLIPKEGFSGRADQYRPITCLNTTYKLVTPTLAGIIMDHAMENEVLPIEQKALRKGMRGCLDALAVDGAIAEEAKNEKRNLSVAWVDYRKAYDLVPHRWITKVLRATSVPRPVRVLMRKLIAKWATDLCVWTPNSPEKIPVEMKRGIFQGDSLSPLLFCICVAPLSEALRKTKGFQADHQVKPITHLMYMDDLKVYAEDRENLEEVVRLVEKVSGAMGMELGLRKCAVAHMVHGVAVMAGGVPLEKEKEKGDK